MALHGALLMAMMLQTPGVRIDSANRQVVISAAAGAAAVAWPVNGWVHGFHFRAFDRNGRVVSRAALHHLVLLNLERRDLFYQLPERLLEMGRETADISLPATIGIPLARDTRLLMVVMWNDDSLADATVELVIDWTAPSTAPSPVTVLPVTLQVAMADGATTFDLRPGEQRWSQRFAWPVSGRLIAVGAHLHDMGVSVSLRDAERRDTTALLTLRSRHDAAGHVVSMERAFPGLLGTGTALTAGHGYVLDGLYQNTTGRVVVNGGMVFLYMLYAPDRLETWPAADDKAANWLRYLDEVGGTPAHGMRGMHGGGDHDTVAENFDAADDSEIPRQMGDSMHRSGRGEDDLASLERICDCRGSPLPRAEV